MVGFYIKLMQQFVYTWASKDLNYLCQFLVKIQLSIIFSEVFSLREFQFPFVLHINVEQMGSIKRPRDKLIIMVWLRMIVESRGLTLGG